MKIEDQLRNLIVARYDNVSTFTKAVKIPNSTFASIMQRGIINANVSSIAKICHALQISMDALVAGQIVTTNAAQLPEGPDVADKISEVCIMLDTRNDLTFNGRPLTEENSQALYDLLVLASSYIQNRQ